MKEINVFTQGPRSTNLIVKQFVENPFITVPVENPLQQLQLDVERMAPPQEMDATIPCFQADLAASLRTPSYTAASQGLAAYNQRLFSYPPQLLTIYAFGNLGSSHLIVESNFFGKKPMFFYYGPCGNQYLSIIICYDQIQTMNFAAKKFVMPGFVIITHMLNCNGQYQIYSFKYGGSAEFEHIFEFAFYGNLHKLNKSFENLFRNSQKKDKNRCELVLQELQSFNVVCPGVYRIMKDYFRSYENLVVRHQDHTWCGSTPFGYPDQAMY